MPRRPLPQVEGDTQLEHGVVPGPDTGQASAATGQAAVTPPATTAPATAPPVTRMRPAAPRTAAVSALTTARELVTAATIAAKEHPSAWEPFSVKLPGWLRHDLKARVTADLAAMQSAGTRGYSPADAHYIAAALAAVPDDPAVAAQWAAGWVEQARQAGRTVTAPVQTGSRAPSATKQRMLLLTRQLGMLPDPVPAWQVHASAVQRLLDALARESEPPHINLVLGG